jgi:transposase
MFYVGIDIAKFKHDFAVLDDNGEEIVAPRTITNSSEGFAVLYDTISSLDHSQEIKIGIEATGHYGDNLKQFLLSKGLAFTELNPFLVKLFHEQISLRRTKTDRTDCEVIAMYMAQRASDSYQKSLYHFEALKSLTRTRQSLVEHRSQYIVMLTNMLDQEFPEFKDFFHGKLTETAIYILNKYGTAGRISDWTEEDLIDLHNKSRRIPVDRFKEIQEAAKKTVGNGQKYREDEMKIILSLYEYIDDQVTKIEDEIKDIMNELNPPTLSIPGMGVISAATILGEFGDLSRFPDSNKCVAFAGLDVGIYQSGTKCIHGKMVKHGSSHLRYALLNVVQTVCIHCPTFKAYWVKKKVTERKFFRVADSHVAKKLIRMIYHLETTHTYYDEQLCK